MVDRKRCCHRLLLGIFCVGSFILTNITLSGALIFPHHSIQKRWSSTRCGGPVSRDFAVLHSVAAKSTEATAAAAAAASSESISVGSPSSASTPFPLLSTATYSSPSLMDPIVNHPSVRLLELERRPRKKLKPRHKPYFWSARSEEARERSSRTASADESDDGSSLFEKLAFACCDSGVVPRKEFFETYASAKLIHESFPATIHRVADLAAGHGLLSWMLLALDEYREDGSPVTRSPEEDGMMRRARRTAICVDRRMPPSAIAIARSMRKNLFPTEEERERAGDFDDDDDENDDDENDESRLYDRRWTYVQTDLMNVAVDDASTLLVSVHACGTLSDFLIDLAISGRGAPLALVPCCHTYSVRKGYAPHPRFSGTTASDVGIRIEKLQDEAAVVSTGIGGSGSAASGSTATTKAASPDRKTTRKKKINRKFQIVENVIDDVRLKTLRNAGYGNVRIASLPSQFTERNRLFIVHGKNTTGNHAVEVDDDDSIRSPVLSQGAIERNNSFPSEQTAGVASKSIRKGSMPPVAGAIMKEQQPENFDVDNNNDAISLSFTVPLRDDPQSIQDCLSVSGKFKAIQRLRELLPNHFAPKLDVSLWLPRSRTRKPEDEKMEDPLVQHTNVTVQALQEVLDNTVRSYRQQQKKKKKNGNGREDGRYRCTISRINEIFVHPETGRVACTYQIEYTYDSTAYGDDGAPFRKELAKELHRAFCHDVERAIDGIEVR